MSYSVGDVARLAHVTVRTLHHYDQIGLLSPCGRTASHYRLYEDSDLERLQQILYYRELGLSLDEIQSVLDDPKTDPAEHLRRQHDLLIKQSERLAQMLAAVKKALEARKMGMKLNPEEMFEVFGDFDPTEHEAEVEERWGDTDAYRESQRRTASYDKDDWLRSRAEGEQVEARFASAMTSGLPPDSLAAMAAAEAHRKHIDRWFYPCSYAMHRGLAEMYIADPRFATNYERRAAGLAQYVHDAVHANADHAANGAA